VNPLLWTLVGAGGYLLLSVLVGAIIDVEIFDAVKRVLFAPIGLLVAPMVWLALRLPTYGRFPLHRLRAELDAHHHAAVGIARQSWAVVVIRRTGPKAPAPERVP
jgi:hypothetical protein